MASELSKSLAAWADVIDLNSGPFINEDLRLAVTELEDLETRVRELKAGLISARATNNALKDEIAGLHKYIKARAALKEGT